MWIKEAGSANFSGTVSVWNSLQAVNTQSGEIHAEHSLHALSTSTHWPEGMAGHSLWVWGSGLAMAITRIRSGLHTLPLPSSVPCVCLCVCLCWRQRCFISLQPFPSNVKSYWVKEQLYHLKPTTREKGIGNTFQVAVWKPSCIKHRLIVLFITCIWKCFSMSYDWTFYSHGWAEVSTLSWVQNLRKHGQSARWSSALWFQHGSAQDCFFWLCSNTPWYFALHEFFYTHLSFFLSNCCPRVLFVFITKIFPFWSLLHFEFQVSAFDCLTQTLAQALRRRMSS